MCFIRFVLDLVNVTGEKFLRWEISPLFNIFNKHTMFSPASFQIPYKVTDFTTGHLCWIFRSYIPVCLKSFASCLVNDPFNSSQSFSNDWVIYEVLKKRKEKKKNMDLFHQQDCFLCRFIKVTLWCQYIILCLNMPAESKDLPTRFQYGATTQGAYSKQFSFNGNSLLQAFYSA